MTIESFPSFVIAVVPQVLAQIVAADQFPIFVEVDLVAESFDLEGSSWTLDRFAVFQILEIIGRDCHVQVLVEVYIVNLRKS